MKNNDERISIVDLYREVFSTTSGQKVLSHMLWELGLFDANQSNLEMKKYGARLLQIIGYGRVDVMAVRNLLNSLCKQEWKKEEE